MNYALSKIDQMRFGVVTAKATLEDDDDIQQLLKKAKKDHVEFLIVRLPTNNLEMVQTLEKKGALLTDTLIYYVKKKIKACVDCLPIGYSMRLSSPNDTERVAVLAHQTFNGYFGHYHADSHLKKEDCDLVYSSWAANSCKENSTDIVLLIEKNDEIAAFATIKPLDQHEIEGVLYGVSPRHRKNGLHLCLMKLSEKWGVENGYTQMITSTQITNNLVQKNWCRLGFEPNNSYYTFHMWFR